MALPNLPKATNPAHRLIQQEFLEDLGGNANPAPAEQPQERTTDYLRFVTDQFRDENGNVTDQRQTPPLY